MKTKILYFVVLIISIILFFSISKWYLINEEKDATINSERKLNSLYVALQSQKYLLQNDESFFEDTVLRNNQELKKRLQILKSTLQNHHDIMNQIIANASKHEQNIEDYISNQAVFHNSLFYLMEFGMSNSSDLAKRVKTILYSYYHKRLNLKIDKKNFSLKNRKNLHHFLVERHIYIFNEKYKLLHQLKNELKEDALLSSLQKLHIALQEEYTLLYNNEKKILLYIALSSIFLLLLIITLFMQIQRTLHALSSSNKSIKTVYDVFQKFTIFSRGDLQGNIIDVNDKFCKISGYSREELINNNFQILHAEESSKEFYKNMWQKLLAKEPFHGLITNRGKDGNKFYVDSIIVPILSNDGSTLEYINIQHDITELVKTRDLAKENLKIKDQFLSTMSHELRTPLNSIIGFTNILQKNISDKKLNSYIQRVLASSHSLLALINNILDLSKINSGHLTLNPQAFNLKNELQIFMANISVEIEKKEQHLNFSFDYSEQIVLKADFARIAQILNNLFSNAIKFTPEKKNIYFKVELFASELIFTIRDEGIGMSKEVQKRAFNAFEQADNSTTRSYGGTGLGLHIVQSLVQLMHGKLTLDSEEGVGTTFTITIPVSIIEIENTPPINVIEEEDSEYEPLEAHALIVEDNKTNQMLLKLLLEDMGLTYKTANDGVEAVAIYETEKFDIVLMDEDMPNMNGSEAMKIIREKHNNVCPIIALTANAMSSDREKFLALGFDEYLPKPIDEKKLYEILKSELQK